MKFHKDSNIFPLLKGEEFNNLKNDIAINGLIEPIWLHPDGSILDGRNRFLACQELGIEPSFRTWEGPTIEFVVSLNLHRRHLTSSQRAVIAVEILPMLEAEQEEERRKKISHYRQTGETTQKIGGSNNKHSGEATQQAAELFGTNREYVHKAKILKNEAPNLLEKVKSGQINIRNAFREHTQSQNKIIPELPTDKYRVIYADPPWKYGNNMPEYFYEQADHYPLMTIKEIAAMPIEKIAQDNAVLFLWVTSPILDECFEVVSSWGFKYKASFIWDKIKHNMGHYNSVRHEILLICTRGSCMPDVKKLFDSVQSIERTEHSKKPEEFREIIDTLYPEGKRIELFARTKINGWEVYGNEFRVPT